MPHLFSWVLEYCLLWSYILLHFVQRLYIASFGIVYCCILHGCPQTCPPNPVKGLLEVNKDMVEVFLVLKIFITEDSYVEDLLCSAPSCSEACLFFSDDLCLWLQSVQLDFAWMTDEADFGSSGAALPVHISNQNIWTLLIFLCRSFCLEFCAS